MTRRRKQLYAGVFACGAVAMAVDRLWLAGDAAVHLTSPSAPTALVSAAAASSDDTAAGDAAAVPARPFPEGLPVFDPDYVFRDPFVPSVRVDARHARNGRTDKRGEQDPTDPQNPTRSAAAFSRDHRLRGVFVSPRLSIANLDGTWVHVGDEVDGCTVIEIGRTEITVDCSGERAVLVLFDDEASGGR